MKRKFKLVLEYEGSAYHGWQRQPNGITVQEVLENALKAVTKQEVRVASSGRTDAGVHAEGQVAHFVTESKMKEEEFLKALNSQLPRDIVVKKVQRVPKTFDARRSALGKIYRYNILNRDHPSALEYRHCLFIPYPLDIAAMRRAGRYLVGTHDFSAFRASNCDARHPVRELRHLEIRKDGNHIRLFFEGNGFLKHMVRNIVGTLVQVGRRKMAARDVKAILESRDRNAAGPTAQPQGLCLVEVFYDSGYEKIKNKSKDSKK